MCNPVVLGFVSSFISSARVGACWSGLFLLMPLYSRAAARVIKVTTVSHELIDLLWVHSEHASLIVWVLLLVMTKAASLMTQFVLPVVLCYHGRHNRSRL